MLEKTRKVIKEQKDRSKMIDPAPNPLKDMIELGEAVLEDTKDILKKAEDKIP